MKIGIVTFHKSYNYGSALQAYALQTYLAQKGYEVNIIDFILIRDFQQYHLFRTHLYKIHPKVFIRDVRRLLRNIKRKNNFNRFSKKYFLLSEKTYNEKSNLSELNQIYDCFICGSDQVWNPTWYNNTNPTRKDMFLMTFARPEQKVCFAPSFGIEELPDEWRAWFQMQLATFPCVSVREQAGAKIINNLTGKTAEVLIDPTLMLDKKDWFRIAKRPKNVDVKHSFILTYFLGERPEQAEKDIQDIQRESKQTVYHFFDQSQPDIYACGPSEFLYLISKADIVLTDSFHASVFSFLFEKPFIVYERSEKDGVNMNSRLNTLLSMLDLKRKYKASGLKNGFFECNYRIGQEQLKEERMKAEKFLRKAMHL